MLQVYLDLLSQPCRAISILLNHCSIPHTVHTVALRRGEQSTPEFTKLNPMQKVPVLVDNGFVLTESDAILKYLVTKHNVPEHWYPRQPERRARVDEYTAWHHTHTRPHAAKVFILEVLSLRGVGGAGAGPGRSQMGGAGAGAGRSQMGGAGAGPGRSQMGGAGAGPGRSQMGGAGAGAGRSQMGGAGAGPGRSQMGGAGAGPGRSQMGGAGAGPGRSQMGGAGAGAGRSQMGGAGAGAGRSQMGGAGAGPGRSQMGGAGAGPGRSQMGGAGAGPGRSQMGGAGAGPGRSQMGGAGAGPGRSQMGGAGAGAGRSQMERALWSLDQLTQRQVLLPRASGGSPPDRSQLDRALSELDRTLDLLDSMFLRRQPFLCGDDITVADLLAVCEVMQPLGGDRDILQDRPSLQRWRSRVQSAVGQSFDHAHSVLYALRDRRRRNAKL